MKKTLLINFFTFLSVICFGQKIHLEKSDILKKTDPIEALDIQKTIDGNLIFAGGGAEGCILKTDIDGKKIWQKCFGGSDLERFNKIKPLQNGEYICIGQSQSNDGDVANNYGDYDVWVVKLDFFGDIIWEHNYGGTDYDIGSDILPTNDGGFIFIAQTKSNDTDINDNHSIFKDIWIVKIDATGNIVWEKCIGGSGNEEATQILASGTNEFYILGTADSNDGDVSNYHGDPSIDPRDIWLVKIDPLGNILWDNCFGGPHDDYPGEIIKTSDNKLAILGTCGGAGYDVSSHYGIFGVPDVWFLKIDLNGSIIFEKNYGGSFGDSGFTLSQPNDSTFILGNSSGSLDFDVSETYNLTIDFWAVYIDKFGNIINEKTIGGSGIDTPFRFVLNDNKIISLNYSYSNDYDVTNSSSPRNWLTQISIPKISGRIFLDSNANCTLESNERGIRGMKMIINPGNIVTQTDNQGYWFVDSLPAGTYTASIDTLTHYTFSCQNEINFTVSNSSAYTNVSPFGMEFEDCPRPTVSVMSRKLESCTSDERIYIEVCNDRTTHDSLTNYELYVQLDENVTPTAFSGTYTDLGNQLYKIDAIDLSPGGCKKLIFTVDIGCNFPGGTSLCTKAWIENAPTCVLDTLPTPAITTSVTSDFDLPQPCTSTTWDLSSLNTGVHCANDSVHFYVTNSGTGNMSCYTPVLLYVNDTLTFVDSIQLNTQDTVFYSYASNGETWLLQAEQHPLHPGNSHPSAIIEACGSTSNWNPGIMNNLPHNDQDATMDEHCVVTDESYGSSIKRGYPLGIGNEHLIAPNQEMEYVIEFNNTSNDTLESLIIRDTLDEHLNIFSVQQGMSSHPFNFRMYGERILEWRMINYRFLPESIDPLRSKGFVSFKVQQNPDLPNGTLIHNRTNITWDNLPAESTNLSTHKIYDQVLSSDPLYVFEEETNKENGLRIYPNPTTDVLTILLDQLEENKPYWITDISGKIIASGMVKQQKTTIDLSELNSGVYVLKVGMYSERVVVR